MKKLIVTIIALLWASFAYAQFNGCKPGFCPGGIFGGGASPASILPPSMQSNPPDFYANLKTNQAYVKTLSYNPPATDYINVSRSGAATQIDSGGNWIQCLSSVLCRTDLGASIWEARTNSIRNNTMAGAVVMADSVQLLNNPTFAAQGNWVSNTAGGGSVVFSAGQVQITGDGSTNGNYISQQLTGLTVGRNYVVVVVAANGTPTSAVGTTQGGTEIRAFGNVAPNGLNSTIYDRYGFTATQTTHWISFSRVPASTITITSVAVYDGERVENGTFTANPLSASQNTVQNGWQWSVAGGTSTVTWNGVDTVTTFGDGVNTVTFDASFPTAVGYTYTLSFDLLTAAINVKIGTAKGGTSLLSVVSSPGTGLKLQFTATGSTTWLRFDKTTGTAALKNISVQSAGALPTNWTFGALNTAGMLSTITGTGIESGIDYVDVRYNGTSTGAINNTLLSFDTTNITSAVYGQTWTPSVFVYSSAGNYTNITNLWLTVREINSVPSVVQTWTGAFTNATGPLGNNRYSFSKTFQNSSTVFAQQTLQIQASSGVAIDITLRLGWPQLENNSLINATVASATKAADGSGGVNGSAVYSVGGGTGAAATLNVTWAAGVMTVNSVASAGSYTVFPPSPATLTYVSGAATGWTGATVTLTPTDNSAKAAASNPILTINAAVTRGLEADTLILTGLPAFGSTYSAYVHATTQLPTTYSLSQHWLSIDDNSNNNRLVFLRSGTGSFTMSSVSGGTTTSANGPLISQNSSAKAAGADAASDQALSVNGGAVIATSGNLPIGVTLVHLGVNAQANGNFLNGNQEEFAIWFTQRVPNAQLQAMTQ